MGFNSGFKGLIHSKSVVPKGCYVDPGGIRDQFTGDPLTHFCNDNFEVYFSFKSNK